VTLANGCKTAYNRNKKNIRMKSIILNNVMQLIVQGLLRSFFFSRIILFYDVTSGGFAHRQRSDHIDSANQNIPFLKILFTLSG
jgi:hypothetical protein